MSAKGLACALTAVGAALLIAAVRSEGTGAVRSQTTPVTRDLYSVRPDGSRLRRLTNVHDIGLWRLAPDRTRIAFVRETGLTEDGVRASLWAVRLNGTGLRRLTKPSHHIDHEWFGWAPGSGRIAYAANVLGRDVPTLHVVDVRTRAVQRIAPRAAVPDWGPRDLISYLETEDNGFELTGRAFVVRLNRRVVWKGAADQYVYWSPKRNLVALTSPFRTSLLIREATGRPRRVFQGMHFESWLPDGTRVLISQGGRTMIASAVGPRRIQEIPTARAAWSRDGRRLAYSTEAGLYIGDGWGLNARLRYSWPDPQRPFFPIEWSPDGRFVLVWLPQHLMTVNVATGTARTIVEGLDFGGVRWAQANTIIFSTTYPSRD